MCRPRATPDDDIAIPTDPTVQYDMGESQRDPIDLYDWVAANSADPAVEVRVNRAE